MAQAGCENTPFYTKQARERKSNDESLATLTRGTPSVVTSAICLGDLDIHYSLGAADRFIYFLLYASQPTWA